MSSYSQLVDRTQRTISPLVWVDPEIYRQEQERIFFRTWLYVGHESQIREPGDFITTYMGEEPVVVWRNGHGRIRVFLNSCRHRGNKLCRLDEGNAPRLTCSFHGWTYDCEGKLVGVPQLHNAYYDELDRGQWGLIEVPQVQLYQGLVFACMDPDAPNLENYLGDAKWYLDLAFGLSSAGLEAVGGTQKWRLKGNWKLGAENFGGDNYHTLTTHASFLSLGQVSQFGGHEPWERDFEAKVAGGHGFLCLTAEYPPDVEPLLRAYFESAKDNCRREGRLSEAQARLIVGGVHVGTIFPNFSYSRVLGCLTVRTWQPRGVDRMEAWITGLVERDAPPAIKDVCRRLMIRGLGATGLIEVDDVEVWAGCQETIGGALRRRFPLSYQMGAGHERREPERPGLICASPTEASSFGFYERWLELMQDGRGGTGA